MPETISPRVLLAFTALDIAADLIGALTTAVGTNHLATSGLISHGTLKECRNFSSVWENSGNLVHSFFGHFEIGGVALVVLKCQNSSFVCATCSLADRTAILHTCGALEIARVPAFTSVWMSWLRISLVVVTRPGIQGAAEKEFLSTLGFVLVKETV
jgi:hypothetical protein